MKSPGGVTAKAGEEHWNQGKPRGSSAAMQRNKGLGQVILQRETHLPWPDKRSAILQEDHPSTHINPRWSKGAGRRASVKEGTQAMKQGGKKAPAVPRKQNGNSPLEGSTSGFRRSRARLTFPSRASVRRKSCGSAGGRKPRTLHQPHIVASKHGWPCAVREQWRPFCPL